MAPAVKKQVGKTAPPPGEGDTERVIQRSGLGGNSPRHAKRRRHKSPQRAVYFSATDEEEEATTYFGGTDENHEHTVRDIRRHKRNTEIIHGARLTVEHFAVIFPPFRTDQLKISVLQNLLWKMEREMRQVNLEFLREARRHNCADCRDKIEVLTPIEPSLQTNSLA